MSSQKLSRRKFIRLSTLAASGAVIAACSPVTETPAAEPAQPQATEAVAAATEPAAAAPTATTAAAAPEGDIVLQWWDHFQPLEPLHKKVFEQYKAAHPNVSVEHTVFNPPEQGKALQLAYPNNQAPDVHSLAGINFPAAALVDEGWFTPLDEYVTDEWKNSLPAGSFIEGHNTFDGKIYSFPIFSFRQYVNLLWYNKQLVEQAGVDPVNDFATWDGVRAAAKKITDQGGGSVFGWIEGISFVDRMRDHIVDAAMGAGSPGVIDFKTGEYQYNTDPFVNAVEWWVAMANDGSLFPGSTTLDMRNARARWVTGVAGIFFDGPWNPGSVLSIDPAFMDSLGVAPNPTPDGKPGFIGRNPSFPEFWVSSQTKNPKHAVGLVTMLTSREHNIGLAERMDQPPLMLDVVEEANVHPTYKQSIQYFSDTARLQPVPQIRNPFVNDVTAAMKDIHPNMGEIIQGAISGEVKDIRGALTTYNDAMTAEREAAIKTVNDKGGKVSIEDWVFSDWVRGEDYVTKPNA